MVDALHHVADQTRHRSRALRVFEPGGRIVIEEPDIRYFGVKLIALGEKLLLMRSHFFPPPEIVGLFSSGKRRVSLRKAYTAWVVIEK